jgi:threonine/homoserine/homoserine lactone efflux protein
MIQADLGTFAASTSLLLFIQGPTNAVMMASGAARGLWRTLPMAIVALAGYATAIIPLLALPGLAGAQGPIVGIMLRTVAAMVVAIVALRLWMSAQGSRATARTPQALGIFALTLFNPKALVLALGLMQPIRGFAGLAAECSIVAVVVVLSSVGWAAVGACGRHLSEFSPRSTTQATSIVLACFSVYFLMVAITDVALHPAAAMPWG